ncbi:MAG TPA: protoporphyrinogen oxidase [Fimbriimonadaceae bacterium]|nr:protoporphyrinogen oxidase [Fimbriimonadaceae bacterium]
MSKTVIVGGGIAGLTAAYSLVRGGRRDVVLLEASPSLGGKIRTTHRDGLLIEHGPDSIFTMKPWGLDLICELGLGDEVVEPLGAGFSIFVDGKVHKVPRALASLIPSASSVLEKVGFLSAAARKRVLSESSVAKGAAEDESIASFFRRRFGKRYASTLAEPLLAGIHAGDPERLSMRALYPSYLGLEQSKGSLSGGNGKPPAPKKDGAKRCAFVTLRSGLSTLTETLERELTDGVARTGTTVQTVQKSGSGLTVVTERGERIEADALALATPAYVAAPMLAEVAPETAEALRSVRFVSTAVATFAFPSDAFPKPLEGNGFLVPNSEGEAITGCTFSSLKWPGRAPEGTVLMRVFLGRDGGLDVDAESEEELGDLALEAVQRILKPKTAPTYRALDRWTNAMPQYEIGYLDTMERARRGLSGLPIHLIGSSYGGNGIPDCVRLGREFAQSILGKSS